MNAKYCHGKQAGQKPKPKTLNFETKASLTPAAPWGVPGEAHTLWVVPIFKGQSVTKPLANLKGDPGKYKVQLLLSRPGYPITAEREHKYIDNIIGDSHIAITKPKNERKPKDPDEVVLEAAGKGTRIMLTGLPNDRGYLGKFITAEFQAESFNDAESKAYEAVAPFLSAWSLHLDIPVHVETVQVTELSKSINSLRVTTPHFEMTFAGGLSPVLSDDFCQYSSIYREGMNSNSNFYRFLCFYKIIESILFRRNRINEAARIGGQEIRRLREFVPADKGELRALLKDVYPWRKDWDDFALSQVIPEVAWGKKVAWVREMHLNPLRIGIAHALLKSGEVRITLDKLDHIQKVNTWLPLCRVLARLMMRNEFPTEFEFKMKPLDVAAFTARL